jgi:chromosome segregation protein
MRTELGELYKVYLVTEESIVTHDMNRLSLELSTLKDKKQTATEALEKLSAPASESEVLHLQTRLQEFHTRKKTLEQSESEIARTLGRIEGTLQALSRSVAQPVHEKSIVIDQGMVQDLITELDKNIDHALLVTDISAIHETLRTVQQKITTFKTHLELPKEKQQENDITAEVVSLKNDQQQLEQQLVGIHSELAVLQQEVISIESDISAAQESLRTSDKSRYEQETFIRELNHQEQLVTRDYTETSTRFEALEAEYRAAEELLGEAISGLRGSGSYDTDDFNAHDHQSRKQTIDRLKVRLEDMGGGGSGDIMAEYDETTARDQYLAQQLEDLTTSINDLEKIISELKQSLTTEFHKGIKQINSVFEKFFITMFGGGSAKLDMIDVIPRKRKSDDEEEFIEEETVREQGIDIDVNLPRKKVKDLDMLSGGERSLTSIALLFALSQVNPPPFLVLDETDAALDEANSKKYGDMIETLAIETQLIVVTHNRETMSRASILYGVTLGADDSSTLLSIKFDEAVKVAK